jgi:hypothetical protein
LKITLTLPTIRMQIRFCTSKYNIIEQHTRNSIWLCDVGEAFFRSLSIPEKKSKKSLETLPFLSLEEAVSLTKTHLGLSRLRLAEGQGSTIASTVRTIAVCAGSGASVIGTHHGRMSYKYTKPYMSAFLKIDLFTDFAALCLTDFIDWRYIHSLVCIFDPACELLPPWTKELYL